MYFSDLSSPLLIQSITYGTLPGCSKSTKASSPAPKLFQIQDRPKMLKFADVKKDDVTEANQALREKLERKISTIRINSLSDKVPWEEVERPQPEKPTTPEPVRLRKQIQEQNSHQVKRLISKAVS